MNNIADIYGDLINKVHSSIVNEHFPKKLSLMNGMVGLLLYHSLHSELYSDIEEREYCQDLISEIGNLITKSDKLDRNFFNGPLSFPFIVRLLADMDILDYNQSMRDFFVKNIMYTATFNTFPSMIIGDRSSLGEALFLMSLFDDKDDSLYRYSIQESLIASIDHCERLLYEDIPPLYWRNEMSYQYLHSIYFFLQWAQRYKIYPAKVNNLLKFIDAMSEESNEDKSVVHRQILRKLQGNEVCFFGDANMPVNDRLNIFALLGLYSFLYGLDIFEKFLHEIYKGSLCEMLNDLRSCGNISDKILGIGIGLLYCKFNEKNARNHE